MIDKKWKKETDEDGQSSSLSTQQYNERDYEREIGRLFHGPSHF